MLKINRVLMLVMMLTGGCALQAPPEREQTGQSELIAPDQEEGDCSSDLNACVTSCQERTQPASCYDRCNKLFYACIGL